MNNTVPNLVRYCSPMLKVLEFETCDVGVFLVYDMPIAKYLAFGTPDVSAHFMFHSRKLKS